MSGGLNPRVKRFSRCVGRLSDQREKGGEKKNKKKKKKVSVKRMPP